MEDNIKKTWQSARVNIASDNASLDNIMGGKRKTALESLARRYRWFSNMAWLFLSLTPVSIMNMHIYSDPNSQILIMVLFGSFFLICSIMDRWLYLGIRRIDIVGMSVWEVMEKAQYYRKWHIRFIFILLPFALTCLALLAYLADDIYLRLGMLAGFLFGVALGVRHLLNFLADYKALTSDI
ncbi:MAG: hypothetical protein K2G13_07395 [Muribaculaceae bacterium]|nr:hypothetical protein [Muribaculaceae bacterium]